MSLFDPIQLAKDACGFWADDKKPNLINGFSFDTRELQKGNLFLALKSKQNDGHDYLKDALLKGASGAIVEKINASIPLPQLLVSNVDEAFQQTARIHRQRFSGIIVGITGSCGKTSTKDLVTHLLDERTHSTFLNHNNLLGVPITLMNLDNDLHQYGIIEAGMNIPGEMQCLASMINPNISIITNIYPVHLEGLGSVENIAKEKAFLAQSTQKDGIILFPSHCLNFKVFQNLGSKARILARKNEIIDNYFQNQIIYYDVIENLNETISLEIQLDRLDKIKIFNLPLLSSGMISNVALAISTVLLMGIKAEKIQSRLFTWLPSKHRGQVYEYGEQIFYADCYNANPVSMLDAISIFQKRFSSSSKHLYILGCMGELSDQADAYHYKVGRALHLRPEDKVILIGPNAQNYAEGLGDAGNDFSQILCLQNKEKIFDYLKEFEGVIFLKGSKPYRLWELLPKQARLIDSRKEVCQTH